MSYFDELSPEMDRYIEAHTSTEPDLLKGLRKETYQKTTDPGMISGYIQGRFLSILSKILQPQNILEIGTFTGYATLCLAEGLSDKGQIYTVDKNEELAWLPKKYFGESEYSTKIHQVIGDATEEIKKMDVIFDLVFIDADKENYVNYLKLIKPKLRSGGVILIDNVLWYGKVLEKNPKSEATKQIQMINKVVADDPDFENVILPLRDGVHLIRKI